MGTAYHGLTFKRFKRSQWPINFFISMILGLVYIYICSFSLQMQLKLFVNRVVLLLDVLHYACFKLVVQVTQKKALNVSLLKIMRQKFLF